ncbi:hypothetical protein [Sulfitobacter guttiformis]|uniref:Sulfotransferase family protein n=1 Tax=Sulfitobacter guttiformis TaxID=74349 RepID=A0A420DK18_9RHOB|nr:hypothetical protein [Sulfitobacter guttiformis]KIN71631.1 hypothetical protein Z949_794 [Sulfitobacter guttiformis KCTC 32187]RKE94538.1 hypothetical protein C8N30_3666 [Sulfitobacter guttiformis]
MTAVVSLPWLPIAASWRKGIAQLMDIILHVGAHRTGSTSFQHYVRGNRAHLMAQGTALWEPYMLRKGLFDGLFSPPRMLNGRNLQRRAMGRVRLHTAQAMRAGAQRILVTEENMIGAPRACLRAASLFPAIGERLARLDAAFEGRITRVVMSVRAQDLWWSSVAAYGMGRGHPMPDDIRLAALAAAARTWRDVITDMACALPQAEIKVMPFEQFAGQSDKVLSEATGHAAPQGDAKSWLNRSPDVPMLRAKLFANGMVEADLPAHLAEAEGRWNPFSTAQSAALREAYADDMMWLTAGADGLATLTEDRSRTRAGQSLPAGALTKGQFHDQQTEHRFQEREQGRLAQTG